MTSSGAAWRDDLTIDDLIEAKRAVKGMSTFFSELIKRAGGDPMVDFVVVPWAAADALGITRKDIPPSLYHRFRIVDFPGDEIWVVNGNYLRDIYKSKEGQDE